tara:strand:- start:245 stop:3154 length:2910 start_codon:yes stop_codon:yes gene_type:complete
MMNYIHKHWRGELSLAISFWVNGFLVNIILTFFNYWLLISSPITHPVVLSRVAIIVVIISLLIYSWQIVGLWRACDRHVEANGRAFWARTVQAVVILSLIASIQPISSSWSIYKAYYQMGFQRDTTSAYTLTLRNNDSIIHLEGGLRFGVSKDVATLLKEHPDIKGIILDCVGGRIYEGRELSKLILVYGLDTYSLKGCYSASTLAFISGTNRFLGTGASLGFHQYHLYYEDIDKFVNLKKEQDKDLRIFKRKGIKKEFLEKLYAASGEDLWFPSRDELLSAGVIHGVVNPSDLTPLDRMEEINVREEFLGIPVYRTIQKYEPEVFEQIITDINEQYKNGSTLIKLQETGSNHLMVLAYRLLPTSSNETLLRFVQIITDTLKKLVEKDPLLCLKWQFPEQFGTLAISKYLSREVLESFDDVLHNIIIDAYEKESTPVGLEVTELQIQEMALQLGDDVLYIAIGPEKLQNSDQYKRYCDAQISFFELILAKEKTIAANMFRYIFTLAAAEDNATDGNASDNGNYDGDIVDGKKHGYGTYKWTSGENAGDKYVGEFQNDNVHGSGTYTWIGGDKYVGEFKDNMRSGRGTNIWASGQKYVGEWKDSMRNGQGTNIWPDGEKYVGEWKDDKKHGQGIMTGAKGEKYVGEFKDNNAVGGWYYLADGSRKWAYMDAQRDWKFLTEADRIINDEISQLSKEQLELTQELTNKEIVRIKARKQEIIDEGAKNGKVVSTEMILGGLDELKTSYDGDNPEEYFAAIEKTKQDFREKYGETIPVDLAYKIAEGTETLDSPLESEITSEQLTADTVTLDFIFDTILKSSIEAKNPEDGAKFINDLKQQFSMLYGNSVTAKQAVSVVNRVTGEDCGGEDGELMKKLFYVGNLIEKEKIDAFNALSEEEMLSAERVERYTMTLDHLFEVMDIQYEGDDPEEIRNEIKQTFRDMYGDTVTREQARIIADRIENLDEAGEVDEKD